MTNYGHLLLPSLIFAFIALGGCSKEVKSIEQEQGQGNEPGETINNGTLVSATLISSQLLDDVLQQNIAISSQIGILPEKLSGALDLLSEKFFGKCNWRLDKYKIIYNTRDNRGKSIQLAASVGFVRDTSGKEKRKLEAVSLFHNAFGSDTTTITNMDPIIIPARAFYNHLVVFPYYQGFDIDIGSHPITMTEPMLKARQAIDGELAALQLLDSLGIGMTEDYYTANLGISNGGATALATHYLLENDPEYIELNKNSIHLKGSFMGESCYNFADQVGKLSSPVDLEDVPAEAIVDPNVFKQIVFIACVVGTYDTWHGIRGHFSNVSSVEDYFSENFLTLKTGKGVGYLELFRACDLSVYDKEMAEISFSDMLNPALLDADGMLDMTHPYMKDLTDAFEENSKVILGYWSPRCFLTLSHSYDDDFVDIEQVKEIYNNLSNNGLYQNVKLNTVEGFKHFDGTMYFLLKDIVLKKDPWK